MAKKSVILIAVSNGDGAAAREVVTEYANSLAALGVHVAVKRPGEELGGGGGPVVFFPVTGGTAWHIWEMARSGGYVSKRSPQPLLVLAHPQLNSLPAAFEVVARARQEGVPAKLVYVRGARDCTGYEELISAVTAARGYQALARSRIGLIGGIGTSLLASGQHIDGLTKYFGVSVETIPWKPVLGRRIYCDNLADEAKELYERARSVVEPAMNDVEDALRVYHILRSAREEYGLTALAVNCFELLDSLRVSGCLAVSRLIDEGIVCACEGDVVSAVTMLVATILTGQICFMGNLVRVDPQQNIIWLAHCTVAMGLLTGYDLRSHFESGQSVAIGGCLRQGSVTLVRIGGKNLSECFVSLGELTESPREECLCRTQAVIKLDEDCGRLLSRPLGGHYVFTYGNHARVLRQFLSLAPEL